MEDTDLLGIRDFAKYVGTKQSILRHYDSIGLFKPIHRGKNGYRYYSPLQVTTFNMVKVLCTLKTSLRDITALQRNRTPESILDHLEKQEAKFDAEMYRLHESYAITHMYRRLIREALSVDENMIIEKQMPEAPVFIGNENEYNGTKSYFKAFTAFCQYAQKSNINLSYPIGAIFADIDVFTKRSAMPNYFFSTDPRGLKRIAAGHYLIAYTRGYYGSMNDLSARISEYANERNLCFDGPVYSLYLLDEVSIHNPDSYMARISVRLKTPERTRQRN